MKVTKFTFRFKDGKYPVNHKGDIEWVSSEQEAIRQGWKWGASRVIGMDDSGKQLFSKPIKKPATVPSSA